MTDPRPSENDRPDFTAVAEYGRKHLGWTNEPEEVDLVEDLLRDARHANGEARTALAQMAAVRAIQAQTAVLTRIADALERIDITVELPGGAS